MSLRQAPRGRMGVLGAALEGSADGAMKVQLVPFQR
jgi:hypothetical protein